MGERTGLRLPVLLVSASLTACHLDWTVPRQEGGRTEVSGGHAHTSTAGAVGSGGATSTPSAGGAGGGAVAQSSSQAASSSSSSSSSSGGATCAGASATCQDCEACADPICFADCYADTGIDGCQSLDQCVNAFCAGNDACIAAECYDYPSDAWAAYYDSIDCMYCRECATACGCGGH